MRDRRSMVLALALLGCTSGRVMHDAGAAGPDAASFDAPPRADVYVPPWDAGSSRLEVEGAAQTVSDACSLRPRLTSNGAGWVVWWPDGCDAIREIDADGALGASLPLTVLPVDQATYGSLVKLDAVAFAHGVYGLAGRQCSSLGPCVPDHLASLARDGTSSAWTLTAPGDFLGLAGWDDRADWLTLELRTSASDRVPTSVLRDATFAPVTETELGPTLPAGFPLGGLLPTPHVALAWWSVTTLASTTASARSIAPDGSPLGAVTAFPYFVDDVDPMGETLVMLDVLPYMAPSPPPRGIAMLDPSTALASSRSALSLQEPVDAPRIAPMPELGLVGLCWTHPGRTATELYVQVVDMTAGAQFGIRTLVASGDIAGHDCGWSGSHLVVVWGQGGTQVRAYRVTP